jgi:predicted nucleotidyltransferase component of viral defense system
MIDQLLLNKIKRLTISALVSDENLMGMLVLKGGNALDLAYDIGFRGSIDIDFSIEGDFIESERDKIQFLISELLKHEFIKEGLSVFDVKLTEKPHNIHEEVKSFWGGYLLEFKLIDIVNFQTLKSDLESLRKMALPIHQDNSTKFTVDISKYEYVSGKKVKDLEGALVNVYSPEMLAIEKLRALCQQVPAYKEIIYSMTSKSRSRDFYDIYNLTITFSIDYTLEENIELCRNIFNAKRVPIEFIKFVENQREFHRQSWASLSDTVNQKEDLKEFDFYFDFVLRLFKHLV